MTKYSFGSISQNRVKRVLDVLLVLANESEAGDLHDLCGKELELVKEPCQKKLRIKTNLDFLARLTHHHENSAHARQAKLLTKGQIREALYHLDVTLGMLEDNRMKEQGNKVWLFTIKLEHSYRDKQANLNTIESRWPQPSSKSAQLATPEHNNKADQEITNPNLHLSAIQAVLTILTEPPSTETFNVRYIYTSEELITLWELDQSAYGQASIPLPVFYSWWEAFECGLKVLFMGEQIIGACGIWPLSEADSTKLHRGEIKEVDLRPRTLQSCRDSPAQIWYISGILLREDFRSVKLNPIHFLLSAGINLWLESLYVGYPVKILALASSAEGEAMLGRFSFIRICEAESMADTCPLYCLRANSRSDLLSIFKKRHLC